MKRIWRLGLFLFTGAVCAGIIQAQQPADNSQSAPTPAPKDSTDAKTKKVWTEEDLHRLGGVSVIGDSKSDPNAKTLLCRGAKDSAAASYKQQLARLQAQLDDTDKKLAELEKFNGENSSDTAIRLNHHLDRTSIADQIAHLQAKKKQLMEQIQNVYDQARRNGIQPGALR